MENVENQNTAPNAVDGQENAVAGEVSGQENAAPNEVGLQDAQAPEEQEEEEQPAQPILYLRDFLQKENIKTNDKGQFVPDNNQLKTLIRCTDEATDELINLGKIDTSGITSMRKLFARSTRENFDGIENWNTSRVKTFTGMFWNAKKFNADISNWDVRRATTFDSMFYRAFEFDQPIGAKWQTDSSTNMHNMFRNAQKFNNGGQAFGANWKMDKVETTDAMFWAAYAFNAPGLNDWNMSKVKKLTVMFASTKVFNQPIDKWDLSSAEDMWGMFWNTGGFNQDLSSWGDKLGNAKGMGAMFANAKALTINFLSAWQIPDGCDTGGIINGTPLSQGITTTAQEGAAPTVHAPQKPQKVVLTDFLISELKTNGEYKKFGETQNFLSSWVPLNIKERFKVYLAKHDEESEGLVAADEKTWECAFCNVFDQDFLIERFDDEYESILEEPWIQKEREFIVWQAYKAEDFDDFDEKKTEKAYENEYLKIFFATRSIWIVNSSILNISGTIFSIVISTVLALAYKRKMRDLDRAAKNYKTPEDLDKSYEDLCTFDLHAYQNTPFLQNELEDTLLINVWRKMSEFYMVAPIHEELKDTIYQISQLVNGKKQDKLDMIMFWVAIWSAIAALLALVPVVEVWL